MRTASTLANRGIFQRAALLLVVVLVMGTCGTACGQSKDPTIAAIEKAWKARQERFHSVEMKWTTRQTDLKGSVTEDYPPSPQHYQGILPPNDMVFQVPSSVILQGKNVRFEYSGREWNIVDGSCGAITYVCGNSQDSTKEVYPFREGKDYPMGSVCANHRFDRSNHTDFRPIVYAFRPMDPYFFGVNLSACVVANRASRVRDVAVVELQCRSGTYVRSYWLDPNREYVLVKHLSREGDQPLGQIEIEYREDPKLGWVPKGWEYLSMGEKGKVGSQKLAIVSELQVGGTYPTDAFDLQFPSGTLVYNLLDDTKYIIRTDHSKRFLTKAEIRISPVEILRKDAAEIATRTAWMCAVIALGMCLALLCWRLAYRSRQTPKSKAG
jgi:hypothetical protein